MVINIWNKVHATIINLLLIVSTWNITEENINRRSATRGKYLVRRKQDKTDESSKNKKQFVYKEDLHILMDIHELTYMLEVRVKIWLYCLLESCFVWY